MKVVSRANSDATKSHRDTRYKNVQSSCSLKLTSQILLRPRSGLCISEVLLQCLEDFGSFINHKARANVGKESVGPPCRCRIAQYGSRCTRPSSNERTRDNLEETFAYLIQMSIDNRTGLLYRYEQWKMNVTVVCSKDRAFRLLCYLSRPPIESHES